MNMGIETETVEFKRTTGELKAGIISLASMLNKNGYGSLYFGVKDSGEIIGQQIGNRTLREISQAVANSIKPQIIPAITLEYMDDKYVIKVIAEGSDRPYSAFGKYYMRLADEDRELSPGQLRALLMKKSDQDPIVHMESSRQSLSFGQLKTLYSIHNLTIHSDEFAANMGFRMPDGKYNYMAELLADENDVSLKVVTFAGKDKSFITHRNEYGYKCLLISMEQVITYMESIDETAVRIGSCKREEKKLFDVGCFREAWINACLHTKWEKKNPPAVYVFQDRIEIVSTGGLPVDLSEEEFYKGISKPVNPLLQKIFGQLGYVEQTGHGVPMIINRYGTQAFDISDNFLTVTIPFGCSKGRDNVLRDEMSVYLNASETKLMKCIEWNPTSTIADMVRETGFSDGYVRKMLSQLKEKDVLTRVGAKKNGYWKIKQK